MPFDGDLANRCRHDIDHGSGGKFCPKKWDLEELKRIVERWQTFMYENGG